MICFCSSADASPRSVLQRIHYKFDFDSDYKKFGAEELS